MTILNKFLKELDQRTKALESKATEDLNIMNKYFAIDEANQSARCNLCDKIFSDKTLEFGEDVENFGDMVSHELPDHLEYDHGMTFHGKSGGGYGSAYDDGDYYAESKATEDALGNNPDEDWWRDDPDYAAHTRSDVSDTMMTHADILDGDMAWNMDKKSKQAVNAVKAKEIDSLDSIAQAEFDSPYDDLSEEEKQEVNSIMDDPWQGESKEADADNIDADDYYDSGILILDEEEEIIKRNELQNALTDDDVMNRWGDISDDMRGDTGREAKANEDAYSEAAPWWDQLPEQERRNLGMIADQLDGAFHKQWNELDSNEQWHVGQAYITNFVGSSAGLSPDEHEDFELETIPWDGGPGGGTQMDKFFESNATEEAGDIHGFLSEDEWGNVVDPSETEWNPMSGDWDLPDNEETDIQAITSGRAPLGEYEGEDEPEYHDDSIIPAEEDLTEKDIADYYESQDKETEGDDQELLDFYASQSDEAKEHDVEITEPATEYELEIETEEEDGLEPEGNPTEYSGVNNIDDEKPDIGTPFEDTPSGETGGQAGTIWACPECGFNTISKDEYDVHNSKHGNIPATVGSPLSEENIAVQHSDYQILSRFR